MPTTTDRTADIYDILDASEQLRDQLKSLREDASETLLTWVQNKYGPGYTEGVDYDSSSTPQYMVYHTGPNGQPDPDDEDEEYSSLRSRLNSLIMAVEGPD